MRYRRPRSTRWKLVIRTKIFSPLLSFVIIGLLWCSSLQMFYSSSLRHTCLAQTPLKVFPCSDQFERGKSGCCHSKFCHCNRNFSIVLNPHNLEPIISNLKFQFDWLNDSPARSSYIGEVFLFFITRYFWFTREKTSYLMSSTECTFIEHIEKISI